LRQTASASAVTPLGGPTAGIGYADPRTSSAWASAELDLGLASGAQPGTSYVRADSIVAWLDVKPLADHARGHRIHLAAANGCPATDRGVVGVHNDAGPDLSEHLLPARPPDAVLICRYYGGNGNPFALRAARLLRGPGARKLAEEVGNIRLGHLDGAETSCPMDDGAAALVAFAYPAGTDVDLWVKLNGCGGVSNGFITSGTGTPTSLTAR
jgi:hypothetical protein